jgi:hypothetical protein
VIRGPRAVIHPGQAGTSRLVVFPHFEAFLAMTIPAAGSAHHQPSQTLSPTPSSAGNPAALPVRHQGADPPVSI